MTPTPATLDFYAHRSGNETHQYCPRKRYLAYHHLGTGINIFPPLYFDVGTAVHAGLAALLSLSMSVDPKFIDAENMQECVNTALEYFHATPVYKTMQAFSRDEQDTLIAGLLWAFWYRAWPTFTTMWQVLFVEVAVEDVESFEIPFTDGVTGTLHMLSRPDAIVKDRTTGAVVAINWKTINSLTEERQANITQSLQVNLEHYYAEKVYTEWVNNEFRPTMPDRLKGEALMAHLEKQIAEYRTLVHEIEYTQIVYLVKGNRKLMTADGTEVDNSEGDNFTDAEKFWQQDSFLCYRYVDLSGAGKVGGKVSWSYRFYKKDNVSYSQLTPKKDWAKQPVWEDTTNLDDMESTSPVQAWVQALNSGKVFPSTHAAADDRNALNPLNSVIVFEEPLYRDRERLERMQYQFKASEIAISQKLIELKLIVDSGSDLEDTLDAYFPQHLISCRKPVRCEFDGRICNTPKDGRQKLFTVLPVGGVWQARIPHHAGELKAFEGSGK